MRRFLIAILLTGCSFAGFAQEDVFFTNYQLRWDYMNPAYIPELQYATISLGGRFQWRGIEGAPSTFYLSGKYFFKGAHSQLSLSCLADKIGYQHTIQPKLSFAFLIPVGDDSYLNFGVGGGLVTRGYDVEKVDPVNSLHAETTYDLPKGTRPDAEAGFELLLRNIEVGASVNHLVKGSREVPMHMLFSGYVNYLFQSMEWWRLVSNYSVYNYRDRWKHQLSVYYYYLFDTKPADLFYVGAAYRFNYEGSIMAGVTLWENFSLFYSFDYFFGNLRYGNAGTHEIGLQFKIPQTDKGCYANYGKSRMYTRYTRLSK